MNDTDIDPWRVRHTHLMSTMLDDMLEACRLLDSCQSVTFSVPNDDLLEGLLGNDLLEALDAAEMHNTHDELFRRQAAAAVASDMLQFLFDGIGALQRGHVTVAYALIRKPMRDHLLTIEWLFVDGPDFAAKFRSENPRDREVAGFQPDRKRDLLQRAALAASHPGTTDFLADLRYKRDNPGLAGHFDRAVHMVTSGKGYQTDPMSLNFVLGDQEARDHYTDYMYFVLPVFIHYAANLLDAVASEFADTAIDLVPRNTRRNMAFLALHGEKHEIDIGERVAKHMGALDYSDLHATCTLCSQPVPTHELTWQALLVDRCLVCPNCGELADINLFPLQSLPEP